MIPSAIEPNNEVGAALFKAMEQHVCRPMQSKLATEIIIANWDTVRAMTLMAEATPYKYQLLAACLYSDRVGQMLLPNASLRSLHAIGDEAVTKWFSIVNIAQANHDLIAGVKEEHGPF